MKKVAIVFQTHNLEEFAVKNFRLLKEKLPHNYDLFLSVDVDHYKAIEYMDAYSASSVIPVSRHDTLLQQTLGKHDLCLWHQAHTPLLNMFSRAKKEYDYYYLIENDLYADNWTVVFNELENVDDDFIGSNFLQHPDNEFRFEGGRVDTDTAWIWWPSIDHLPWRTKLGVYGPFQRYSRSAVEALMPTAPMWGFWEAFIPTFLFEHKFSMTDCRSLWAEKKLTSAIYHDKTVQSRLGSNDPFFLF